MGLILDLPSTVKVHAEARRESFYLTFERDFQSDERIVEYDETGRADSTVQPGRTTVELAWKDFAHLERAVKALRQHIFKRFRVHGRKYESPVVAHDVDTEGRALTKQWKEDKAASVAEKRLEEL